MLQVSQRQVKWIGYRIRCMGIGARQRMPWLLLLPLLFSAGCLRPRETAVEAALPLNNSLPAAWEPLRSVEEINLDADAIPEYLLFFTYDGANGPVGAVIYDNRPGSTETDAGNRPSASLVPYPLLPNYRSESGHGFLAEPDQQQNVAAYPLNFRPIVTDGANGTGDDAEVPSARNDALAILGGNSYLTFVWWQPLDETYGITQLYAPGRFEAAPFQPFNWAGWREDPQPIREIITTHPLHDRNLLCYRRQYTLVSPNLDELNTVAAGEPVGPIIYSETNLGLDFCNQRPATPFYPEGVVLAYLLGNESLFDPQGDAAIQASVQTSAAPDTVVYVNDLASYKIIPDGGTGTRTVQVCAEVVRPGTLYLEEPETTVAADAQGNAIVFEPTDTQGAAAAPAAPPYALQWLLFTLRHQPFSLDPPAPTADRLFITTVIKLPVAARHLPLECKVQLGRYS